MGVEMESTAPRTYNIFIRFMFRFLFVAFLGVNFAVRSIGASLKMYSPSSLATMFALGVDPQTEGYFSLLYKVLD